MPDDDGRISMVISGELTARQRDGALAYLIMCEPEDIQVMCATYHSADGNGERVLLAGGYNRVDERRIVLDPCLAYPDEQPLE